MIGVSVAGLALARGMHRSAAVVLGASAQLRGADDLTDPRIARLHGELSSSLGDAFGAAYGEGRRLSRTDALGRIDPARLDASE
jgi:hypothetical protein